MTETSLDDRARDNGGRMRGTSGASRMAMLAETYPELTAFTPDATLTEIKTRYGLNSFEQVLELGRRRQQRR
jgi:hypothetical protein